MLKLFFAFALGALLSGCATLRDPLSPAGFLVEQFVQNKVITFAYDQENPRAAAQAMITIADDVIGMAVRGDVVTADAVIMAIRDRVDMNKLSVADQLTVESLLAYLSDQMNRELETNPQISGDVKVVVERLAGRIKYAAGLVR